MEKHTRLALLDMLRGFAVMLMVVYHAAYDLQMFSGWPIDVTTGGFWLLARGTAVSFLLLSGFSLALMERSLESVTRPVRTQRRLKRFLRVALAGLLVTLGTWIFDRETYVRFGILHLIAVGGALLPILRGKPLPALVTGLFLFVLPPVLGDWHPGTELLLPLGVTPRGFATIDYFPLLPWAGVLCVGFALGSVITLPSVHDIRPLSFVGRHSLAVYLLHQPLILAVLAMARM